jgi:hypothetical protein
MRALAAILAGAAMLAWPALLNGYPLVFIDTVSYLNHTTVPEVPWDKTPAYGPFLHLFHWRISLWPAVAAQTLIASHLVWLTQRMLRQEATSAAAHLLVCAGLAALTSAPWFLATLMPDALTPLAPLCLLLLAFGGLSRGEACWVVLLGALAVAAHLSHLPTALAILVLVALLARRVRPVLRAALPVALAVGFLLVSNAYAFGRATLSPHGAVFLLARLQADGPAVAVMRDRCPGAGWDLCNFLDRMPIDSDEFLWVGTSPLNSHPDGTHRPMSGVIAAPQAREIVAATLRERPLAVALSVLRNTAAQLLMPRVGDTLVDTYLSVSARRPIAAAFPARELAAFEAGAQMRGVLPARAAPFLLPHVPVLVVAALAAPLLLWRAAKRRDLPRGALLAGALVALLANAAATGGLSKPHHRYEARIAWLLPLAVMLAALPQAGRSTRHRDAVGARQAAGTACQAPPRRQ